MSRSAVGIGTRMGAARRSSRSTASTSGGGSRSSAATEGLSPTRDDEARPPPGLGIPQVAIAGYTNAGKSTLMNAPHRADVLVADQLFATLDPTVRRLSSRRPRCTIERHGRASSASSRTIWSRRSARPSRRSRWPSWSSTSPTRPRRTWWTRSTRCAGCSGRSGPATSPRCSRSTRSTGWAARSGPGSRGGTRARCRCRR